MFFPPPYSLNSLLPLLYPSRSPRGLMFHAMGCDTLGVVRVSSPGYCPEEVKMPISCRSRVARGPQSEFPASVEQRKSILQRTKALYTLVYEFVRRHSAYLDVLQTLQRTRWVTSMKS